MSSEVCLDIVPKQRGEFVTQLCPSCGAHGPAASVVERAGRRPDVEDVRDEALVQGGGHDADDGLNLRKAMLPTEPGDDPSSDDSRFFRRELPNSIAAVPARSRGAAINNLPYEAKLLESGDHRRRRRSIDKVDTQQRSTAINFRTSNTDLFFQTRQHGREP